jgi:hypothetical protein
MGAHPVVFLIHEEFGSQHSQDIEQAGRRLRSGQYFSAPPRQMLQLIYIESKPYEQPISPNVATATSSRCSLMDVGKKINTICYRPFRAMVVVVETTTGLRLWLVAYALSGLNF